MPFFGPARTVPWRAMKNSPDVRISAAHSPDQIQESAAVALNDLDRGSLSIASVVIFSPLVGTNIIEA
jgi:hypothetical protein